MSETNLLDQLLADYTALPAAQQAEIAEAVTSLTSPIWVPTPGPQREAFYSRADLLLFGGSAGGGKSDLLCGLATTAHKQSLLMRRRHKALQGMIDRIKALVGSDRVREGGQPRAITEDRRVIEFGAAQYIGDEEDYQGRPRDLLGFDEAAHWAEIQVQNLMGWVRTEDPNQRYRTVLASNPPLDSTGDWLIKWFRPWLDITHPDPAESGELRWFISDENGDDVEMPGPSPVERDGKILQPKSRTFIRSTLSDNPYYVRTGYAATLDAMPEPLRSAMRDGNFMAARVDDEWQVIPTEWITEAQKRWTRQPPDYAPMCALGVDVAQGGQDNTVIAARHDGWFAPLIKRPGSETPTGKEVAGMIIANRRDNATVVIDVGGGYGGGTIVHLEQNNIDSVSFNGANADTGRTKDGKLKFANRRSSAIWRFREALDPDQPGGSNIALPDDPMLRADLTAPRYTVTSRGIQVESKVDIKKRIKRSTDDGDAVIMSWSAGARWATNEKGWRQNRGNATPKVIRHRAHQKRN